MKLGLFGINTGVCALDPTALAQVATTAEHAGWESVWTGEHYVLPAEFAPPSPAPPETPMLDPFVALAAVAAHTSTLRLGTGVTVVPLHQPLALAKRVASIDVLSGGRFLFGVGVGYLEVEFEALNAPFTQRGQRLTDHLAAIEAIWVEESSNGVRAEPRPLQKPGPPLHFGGYVTASYQRAITQGHGWYGFALGLPEIERCIAELRSVAAVVDRPPGLPPLEVSVTPHPRLPLDPETITRLSALGVHRLVLLPPTAERADRARLVGFVEEMPRHLGVVVDTTPETSASQAPAR